MSQPSDASNIDYDSRGTKRFDVWGNSADHFDYLELARNWDLLDGIIGRPTDNSQWPPSVGIGGGIWSEMNRIEGLFDSRSVPIGGFVQWFRPSGDVPLSYMEDKGYVLCDGTLVLDADHEFPNYTGDFYSPDLRNKFIVGADIDRTPGEPGTTNTAPGEMSTGGAGTVANEAGSHTTDHDHTVVDHSHTISNHSHSVAQHTHGTKDHRHILGGVTKGSTADGEKVKRPGTQGVSPVQHAHELPGYTGAVDGGVKQTNLGGPTTTGSAGAGSTSSDGAQTTSSTELDTRPLHVGVLIFMKVRNP